MPLSDGLFLATAWAVADDYPFLEFEEMHVDTLCMQLALDPTRYDVLVMENLFRRRAERFVRRPRRRSRRRSGANLEQNMRSSRPFTAALRTSRAKVGRIQSRCCVRRR